MATTRGTTATAPGAIPVGPSLEEWRAMTAAERESFLVKVLDALSDPRNAMTEGRPHKKAKTRAIDLLGLHFKAMGRIVYLAEEMAVVYPGEETFSPDVLAVVDVPQPEDDERMRAGVLGALGARSISCTDEERARVMSCDEPATLQRWLLRALIAVSAAEALDG
jgi:hypothetical protein